MEKLTELHIDKLESIVDPQRISTGQSDRELHVHDISPYYGKLPAGVIWPVTTGEVSKILTYTYANDIPVTPWGAGTSTEGNPVPVCGGLVLDMTRMDRVLEIRSGDLQVDVEPGVLRKRLNRETGQHGLFFPVDPGADATIGGMIANNASGVQTVKYGGTKNYVMQMTIVLPDGEIIKTGCKARKSSSGYDLTQLFIGSEGTLGVVTAATLRLVGIPEHFLVATAPFNRLEDASEAVATIIGAGLEPAALELLSTGLIQLMNREKGLNLPETPMLFCEFQGVSEKALEETADLARELCIDCGAAGFQAGISEKDRANLWRARHEAWETIHRAHPGKETLIVDAAVPISRYPEMVVFSQKLVDECGVDGYVFGHAGDGNLHVVMAGDPHDAAAWENLESVNHRIVERAIALDGTCTGEHGIGIGKRKFMAQEHGGGYAVMRRIKAMLDPKGLMNPGKIF